MHGCASIGNATRPSTNSPMVPVSNDQLPSQCHTANVVPSPLSTALTPPALVIRSPHSVRGPLCPRIPNTCATQMPIIAQMPPSRSGTSMPHVTIFTCSPTPRSLLKTISPSDLTTSTSTSLLLRDIVSAKHTSLPHTM